MRTHSLVGAILVTTGCVIVACSSSSSGGGPLPGAGGNSGATGLGGSSATGGGVALGGSGGNITIDASFDGAGNTTSTCDSTGDEDKDQDGWSVNAGDCNDCDVNVNPGAIDVETTTDAGTTSMGDEDCDGTPGSSAVSECDANFALEDVDPMNAARSIELCKQTTATDKTFGVIEAKWVRADGSAYSPVSNVGLQPSFGTNVNVQAGQRMLSISSGYSRTESQPGACGTYSCSTSGLGIAPPGFPQDSANCPPSTEINDDVGLELKLRAPTNATGYSFNFRFYSFEYPEWVCMEYNDQFIALVTPPPTGSIGGNICFDSVNNPVSVNLGFFDVCDGCPAGSTDMLGTGFNLWDDAGATVWLQTQAPITGGEEFTIRFAIWDTGDDLWDSTALIDNFKWIANGGSVNVGTKPIPVPK